MNTAQQDRLPETNRSAAVWGLAFSVFLGGIGGGVVFPIIPLLGSSLGLSAGYLGLILSANRITRLVANQPVGIMVSRWNIRLPVILGLLIESVATLAYVIGLYSGYAGPLFLLGRGLWGVGSSFLMVGAMTSSLNLSRRANRGSISARIRTALNLGFPAGLALGGLVAGFWGNEAAFLFATFSSLIAALITWYVVPPAKPPVRQDSHWPPSWRTLFRRDQLLILKDPRQIIIGLMNLLFFFSLQGVLFATLVLVIEERQIQLLGASPQSNSGALMAFMSVSSAVVSFLVGRMLDRARWRTAMVLPALVITILGFLLLSFSYHLASLIAALVMLGIGMGGLSIPLLALLGDITPPAQRGPVVGAYQVFGDIGGSLGPILGLYALTEFGTVATFLGMAVIMLSALPFVIGLLRQEMAASRAVLH